MRILLVEDEPQAAQVLAKGLREEAYATDIAPDGERAVYQAAVSVFDARKPIGITIRVTDDGPGVPPDARDRIFERFTRTNQEYAGAGLGLPIARWIAEAHGGSLVLESTGPAGSTFTVTVPRQPISAHTQSRTRSPPVSNS